MNDAELTPLELGRRIETVQAKLKKSIEKSGLSSIEEKWIEWNATLNELLIEAQKKPEVVIALVGSTGCGKSTLINALLNKRILPVDDVKACTSAVSQVSYLNDNKYFAEIEFISYEDLRKEMVPLLESVPPNPSTPSTTSWQLSIRTELSSF